MAGYPIQFLQAANCSGLACLRGIPTEGFQIASTGAYATAYNDTQYSYRIFCWSHIIDSRNIAKYPLEEFRDGYFTPVPIPIIYLQSLLVNACLSST